MAVDAELNEHTQHDTTASQGRQRYVAPTIPRPNGALNHKSAGQRPFPITKPPQPAKLGSEDHHDAYLMEEGGLGWGLLRVISRTNLRCAGFHLRMG